MNLMHRCPVATFSPHMNLFMHQILQIDVAPELHCGSLQYFSGEDIASWIDLVGWQSQVRTAGGSAWRPLPAQTVVPSHLR